MSFLDSDVFTFVVIPALIFVARVFDVTMGTIRIIFVSRGHKYLAPLIGFFEILIWLVAIGRVMQNLSNISCYLAYAGGFAAGNFVGICLEQKLAMGTLAVRIITKKDASGLIEALKHRGYGVTVVPAEGSTGNVHIVYTVIRRSAVDDVVEVIKTFNPSAFYSVEDVRSVTAGVFPSKKTIFPGVKITPFKFFRKGK